MNKIIYCLFLTLGIVLGFHLSFLLDDTATNAVRVSPVFVNPAVMQRTIAAREAGYVHRVDSLAALNRQLSIKVKKTNNTLVALKRQNAALQQQAYGIMDDFNNTEDTILQLVHCDSLQLVVQEWMLADKEQDSLYEDLTDNLSLQVANRDSVIAVQQIQYHNIRSSFDSLAHQQQPLVDQHLQLQQQVKKQRKKGNWLSTGALILGGIAIYGLIQR